MTFDNHDSLLALELMEMQAQRQLNLIAQADPSDPIVIEARAEMEKVKAEAKPVVQVVAAMVLGILTYYLSLPTRFDPTWGPSGMGIFLIIVVASAFWMFYTVIVNFRNGTIAEQAWGKMQWRQANDIRAMRMQSEADRAAYQAPSYYPAPSAPPPVPNRRRLR